MIENVALTLVTSARLLKPYFHSHRIIVKSDHPVRQVHHKPELTGRMIAWLVELSEFNIKFEPQRPVKAQALADFLADITTGTPDAYKICTSIEHLMSMVVEQESYSRTRRCYTRAGPKI